MNATDGPSEAGPADGEGPDLEGVHPPRQERSRATFDRLVRAARALMAEGGIEAVTVQEVVRRADVGVGSFYARFDGREALIRYLHHDLWADAGAWARDFLDPERWRGASVVAVVGEVTRVLVRSHFAREAELRALWTRALTRPADRIMERTAEWDATFVDGLAALLLERHDALGHPRPERAARHAGFQLLNALRGHVFFPDSLSLEGGFSLQEVTLELTRTLLGYLGVDGAPAGYGDLLSVAPRHPALRRGGAAT